MDELSSDSKMLLKVFFKGAKSVFKEEIRRDKTYKATKNKKEVLKRANYACEICGMDLKDILQIHHIVPIKNHGSSDCENLICVCPNCHKLLHFIYRGMDKNDYRSLNECTYWMIKNNLKMFNATSDVVHKYCIAKKALNER